MKYLNHLVFVVIVFLLSLTLLVGVYILNITGETEGRITVSGMGEVYAVPDIANVSFSVINEAKEADGALQENARKVNEVIDFLKEEEIEESDIKTTSFSIYPRYEYYSDREMLPPEERRVLVGYEARQIVEVKIRNIDKIGSILEGGVAAGANRVSNLSFSIDDESELKKEAREKAILEAKKEAKEIEKQLGVTLKKIVGFNEDSSVPGIYQRSMMQEATEMDAVTPVIEPGENKIESRVKITYEVQ